MYPLNEKNQLQNSITVLILFIFKNGQQQKIYVCMFISRNFLENKLLIVLASQGGRSLEMREDFSFFALLY